MFEALNQYAGWLIAAFAGGVFTAWLARNDKDEERWGWWKLAALAGLAALLALALFGWPFGLAGLWIESAVATALAFAGGGLLGLALWKAKLSPSPMWRVGAASAAIIWFLSNLVSAGPWEGLFKRSVNDVVAKNGADPSEVGVAGRVEHGAKFRTGHAFDKPGLQDQCLAASVCDFRSQLLEQRARVGTQG